MKLGILGGGQLARMLALAAHPLGIHCTFLDPATDACAAAIGEHICADYDDTAALKKLAAAADCLTFEFENVPQQVVELLAAELPLYPSPSALRVARDRLHEKQLFQTLDIPTAEFIAINGQQDLIPAVEKLGLPCVLKTRSQGYDGKGQTVLRQTEDIDQAFERIGAQPAILEQYVGFARELSIIAVRTRSGEKRFYSVCENEHRHGVLHLTRNRLQDPQQDAAEVLVSHLLDQLGYVGVLTLELFEVNGQLLANEFAPRVHNSGHWTIEGARTSQFENHLRAVLGLPLGDTASVADCVMLNLLGEIPPAEELLQIAGAHLHLYGKQPKPGRKLGHLTLCDPELPQVNQALALIADKG